MIEKQQTTPYDIFILVLCTYVLIELAIETFLPIDDTTLAILEYLDTGVCLIFIGDFVRNLYQAKRKLEYLKWGWIDLISSLPTFDTFRIGRAFRVFRILHVLRGAHSTKRLLFYILRHRAEASFYATATICVLLVIFASLGILQVEVDENANIKTAEDALWWAFATITTVGYGDKFPISFEGRIIAAGLMVAGVGLFGSFTGLVATWLLSPQEEPQTSELEVLRTEIAELKQLLLRDRDRLD